MSYLITLLVSAGHRLEDVRKYTLRQALVFANEVVVQRQQTLYNTASVMRGAFHADDDKWRALTRALEVDGGS